MEIQRYSKKKLYEMLRSIIFGLLNREVVACLFDASRIEDRLAYRSLLLKTFDLNPAEYSQLLHYEAYARDLSGYKPSYYALTKKDLISILANLISRLDDDQCIRQLALLETTDDGKYIHPAQLNEFLQLRISEFNEILNYEENLAISGVKDNGLFERSPETEALIKYFLIAL